MNNLYPTFVVVVVFLYFSRRYCFLFYAFTLLFILHHANKQQMIVITFGCRKIFCWSSHHNLYLLSLSLYVWTPWSKSCTSRSLQLNYITFIDCIRIASLHRIQYWFYCFVAGASKRRWGINRFISFDYKTIKYQTNCPLASRLDNSQNIWSGTKAQSRNGFGVKRKRFIYSNKLWL